MSRISYIPLFASLFAASHSAWAAPTGLLNDTGQDTCYNGSTLAACTATNAGNAASYPRQDGRFGRDAAQAGATLTKTGAGAKNFDYTKIANNGTTLAAGAALGTAATDWACTRDNVTGLVWEVKSPTSANLRYSGHTYSWYDGSTGSTGSDTCTATLPSSLCNTSAYITAVNAAALCSYNNWRLPTRRELLTLVHNGASSPALDGTYFPNTISDLYWSSNTYMAFMVSTVKVSAWLVNFSVGDAHTYNKAYPYYVRLVRPTP